MKKKRVPIPKADAAKVLFASDRTCCVCRIDGKKLQIHHIDDDPSNNSASNLSVLCLECHGDTQIKGGFGRQLDAEQVKLYRDDWHRIVASRRVQDYREARDEMKSEGSRIKYLTSLIERLRDNNDYMTLASIYDDTGNSGLRDKYIDLALSSDDSDWRVIYLRAMQDRRDLISDEVAERRLSEQGDRQDWSQRARTLVDLGRYIEAAHDYVKDVLECLEQGNVFSAGYYLKELYEEGIVDRLFERALQKAADEGDIWWQVRSLQELGWDSELEELLISSEEEIRNSGDRLILPYLLRALGRQEEADQVSIELAVSRKEQGDIFIYPSEQDESEDDDSVSPDAS